jgi:pyruvate dehydrogenase complex dehydrogenase (E1) component
MDKIINESHGTINLEKYNIRWQRLIDSLLKKEYKDRPDINNVCDCLQNEKINNEENSLNIKHSKTEYEKKVHFKDKETLTIKKKLSDDEIAEMKKKGLEPEKITSKHIIINIIFFI